MSLTKSSQQDQSQMNKPSPASSQRSQQQNQGGSLSVSNQKSPQQFNQQVSQNQGPVLNQNQINNNRSQSPNQQIQFRQPQIQRTTQSQAIQQIPQNNQQPQQNQKELTPSNNGTQQMSFGTNPVKNQENKVSVDSEKNPQYFVPFDHFKSFDIEHQKAVYKALCHKLILSKDGQEPENNIYGEDLQGSHKITDPVRVVLSLDQLKLSILKKSQLMNWQIRLTFWQFLSNIREKNFKQVPENRLQDTPSLTFYKKRNYAQIQYDKIQLLQQKQSQDQQIIDRFDEELEQSVLSLQNKVKQQVQLGQQIIQNNRTTNEKLSTEFVINNKKLIEVMKHLAELNRIPAQSMKQEDKNQITVNLKEIDQEYIQGIAKKEKMVQDLTSIKKK